LILKIRVSVLNYIERQMRFGKGKPCFESDVSSMTFFQEIEMQSLR